MESRTDQLSKFANEMYLPMKEAHKLGYEVVVIVGCVATYIDLLDPQTGARTPVWSWIHDEEEK